MAESLKELVAKASTSEISSVRTVLAKIIEVINSPNSSAMDLKNLIEVDPPLASRMLKIANSAIYGVKHPLSQILDAIITIGFEAVRELALSQKVCEIFSRGEKFFGYTRTALWMHSVAVAVCGKMIYRKEFRKSGDDIYTAGLLHDIGIIVEDQFCHTRFLQILERLQTEKRNIHDLEAEILGFTHMDIGKALAMEWNFPPLLADIIGLEGNPKQATSEQAMMTQTLFVANHACNLRKIGFKENHSPHMDVYQDCLLQLNITDTAISLIMDDVEKTISQMVKEGWF